VADLPLTVSGKDRGIVIPPLVGGHVDLVFHAFLLPNPKGVKRSAARVIARLGSGMTVGDTPPLDLSA
jgi:hypothetical protein